MKSKRIKIGSVELAKTLINKLVEKHGVDYDFIMKNQKIDNRVWCSHYSWTSQEKLDYKNWYIDFYYNNVLPRRTKKRIKEDFVWFDIMYGLRIEDNE